MIYNNTSLTNDPDRIKRVKIINNVKRNKATNNYLFICRAKFYKYYNYYYSFFIILSKNIYNIQFKYSFSNS